MTDRDPDPSAPDPTRPASPAEPTDPFDPDALLPPLELDPLPARSEYRAGPHASGSIRTESGVVAAWEAGASNVTLIVGAIGLALLFSGGGSDRPALASAGFAILLLAIVANRVVNWLDESETGSIRGAIAHRVADLWDTSLGSFYGVMTFVRFVQLEIETLLGEFAGAGSIGEVLEGEFFEILTGFSIQSIMNSIEAAMWPVGWITNWGLWGIAGLVVGAKVWDAFHDLVDARLGRHPSLPPE